MIPYEDALAAVCRAGAQRHLRVELVDVSDIAGRVCTENIVAPIANQPFDNSAMDGFALRAGDLADSAEGAPTSLEVIGHIAAGEVLSFSAPLRGQCYEIMTGARMPPGCDAVVPLEKTEKAPENRIAFKGAPEKGDNIRRAGADFAVGDALVEKGESLKSGHILALATLGIGRVRVLARPRVAVVSTGREIVENFDSDLAPGQIYNSTRPYLESSLRALGADVRTGAPVPDDSRLFKDRLSDMIESDVDIGISTGAVSAGVHDFVPEALKGMGAEILFHKVAIKPGKPILFARFPSGMLYFGLPGNPASTAAGLRFFVQPLIRALLKLPPEKPQNARLKTACAGAKGNLRLFVRGTLGFSKEQKKEIEIPPAQQSFMVRPFMSTDAWAVIPESCGSLDAGTNVSVFPDG